jgi:hypothetical protein
MKRNAAVGLFTKPSMVVRHPRGLPAGVKPPSANNTHVKLEYSKNMKA